MAPSFHISTQLQRAPRKKGVPILLALEFNSRLFSNADQHRLFRRPYQAQNVQNRSRAPAIPNHQPEFGLLGHFTVLGGIELKGLLFTLRHAHVTGFPLTDVIATGVTRAVHRHLVVLRLCKVLLHGLVSPVCIPDQDRETPVHDVVDPGLRFHRQPRYPPGAANEHRSHCMLRVLVIVSTRTASALPWVMSNSVIAFIVAPERYKSSNSRTLFLCVCALSTL